MKNVFIKFYRKDDQDFIAVGNGQWATEKRPVRESDKRDHADAWKAYQKAKK